MSEKSNEEFKVDFIGIGAPRCGTSWIAKCLAEHPEVCFSNVKETNFFDTDYNYENGISFYKEFFPIETVRQSKDFLVQFHGSYIPLQGIDKIVETANILKDDKSIKFRFIGKGQIYKEIKLMIDKYQLDIELIPWLSIPELNKKLNEADIILGVFGETDKADRVVPNKVFQGLAVKKSVITKDTPAIRSLFNDEEIFMCSNSPQDIADSIMLLHKNKELRQSLSQNGYNICMRKFSEKKVPELLVGKLYCYGR